MPDQTLTQQLELLTIDVTILRLVVAKMLAGNLRVSEEPDQIALRRFADEVYKEIDKGPKHPTAIHGMPEMTRARFDSLMRAVRVEMQGQDA
jgi:hypothetical protein